MDSTGPLEKRLVVAHRLKELGQKLAINLKLSPGRLAANLERAQAVFAASPAGTVAKEKSLDPTVAAFTRQVDQKDLIARLTWFVRSFERQDLIQAVNDALVKQKPQGQFLIIARGAQ